MLASTNKARRRLGMLQSLVRQGLSPALRLASGSVAAACDDFAVQTQGCIKDAAQAVARVGLPQHGQLGVEGTAQAVELDLAVALRTGGLFGERPLLLQRRNGRLRLIVVGHQQAAFTGLRPGRARQIGCHFVQGRGASGRKRISPST
jgi:hypothetical protein